MNPVFENAIVRTAVAALCLMTLGACAPQRIRDHSSEQLRIGQYENALSELEQGVKDYPDSTLLKSGLLSARAEALSRLIAQASRERAEGRLKEAEASLARAKKMDGANARVAWMLEELENEKRAETMVAEAQKAMTKSQWQDAQNWVANGLQFAPRHSVLLALKRQLEGQLQSVASVRSLTLQDFSKPVTVEFRSAPLSTVLDALSRSSGVQFMLDRDVRTEGLTTVHMRNARLSDILDAILPPQQLARKVIDPKTVFLYPNTPEKQREHQELVVRAFYLSHVEAKNVASMLRSVLKLKEPFVDERANLVLIRESPDNVLLAEKLVGLQDVAEPEVMLEVEVLEVKTSRLKELGIQFPSTFSLTPLPATGASGLTVEGLRNINASQVGVGVSGVTFNLRRELGDFNTLANPRLRARNKEKAKIMIGDKVPVITTTTGTNGLVSENVSYLDVGLKFDVEPTVYPDEEVLIKLGLEVSTIVSQLRSAGGSTAYQIGTRNASTALRLKDGETQILGGLINRSDRSTANRIPGLGDLPLAGRIFGSQLDDYQESELVLAITPRILRSAPHPTPAQSELWIGSENHARLKLPFVTQSTGGSSGSSSVASSSTKSKANTDATATPKPASTQVSWVAPTEVKLGETFAVTLQVQTDGHIKGAPMEVVFPAQVLQALGVTEGEFFKQAGVPSSFVHSVNPTTGRIQVGLLGQGETGASGKGSLITLLFKVIGPGDVGLTLASLRLTGDVGEFAKPAIKIGLK